MRPWLLLVCWVSLVVPALGDGHIDDIYFFGDSLTDTGNLAALDPDSAPPPAFEPGRYCDGTMWPEYLSFALLGDTSFAGPFLYGESPPMGNNFAMIGSSTFDTPGNVDLTHQIDSVIAHQGGTLNPRSLYVFCFPTADLAYYYQESLSQQPNFILALLYTWRSALSVYQAIERLHAAGARQFLIFNPPNMGNTPAMRGRQLGFVGYLLSTASTMFLDGALSAFPDQLSGDLYFMDFFELSNSFFLDSVLFGGLLYGLRDFVNPCIRRINGEFVPDPDCSQSAFVDEVHLSSRAHQWVASAAVGVLSNPPLYSVPEP